MESTIICVFNIIKVFKNKCLLSMLYKINSCLKQFIDDKNKNNKQTKLYNFEDNLLYV